MWNERTNYKPIIIFHLTISWFVMQIIRKYIIIILFKPRYSARMNSKMRFAVEAKSQNLPPPKIIMSSSSNLIYSHLHRPTRLWRHHRTTKLMSWMLNIFCCCLCYCLTFHQYLVFIIYVQTNPPATVPC